MTLAFHSVADGDLWAKLALGASVWERAPGGLPDHDVFAFTPTLPRYVDHEWGAGFLFFGLLKFFGPSSLMLLKMTLALGAVLIALGVGFKSGVRGESLLFMAIPAALCILPAYVPVIRSHAFSFFLFAVTLWCLEAMSKGRIWPVPTLVAVTGLWANLHGGWVAGYGIAVIYGGLSIFNRDRPFRWITLLVGCVAITLLNPYGVEYWRCLVPAVLHPRPYITEWQPMPLLGIDAFIGFRILFVLAAVVVVVGWSSERSKKSWTGLIVLAITAFLAFRSRRHAPFFGLAALCFLGPYLESALGRFRTILSEKQFVSSRFPVVVLVLYGALAFWVSKQMLPQASLTVIAPVGAFPVRESDILMHARATGNLAAPFSWGSYAAWRLHPNVKISMDGRYEAAYPEATFLMNHNFFAHNGSNWDQLVRDFPVDYVILDLQQDRLRPEDLRAHGFDLVWQVDGVSALLARGEKLEILRQVARNLPPTTIEPLAATIPMSWWSQTATLPD